MNSYEVSGSFSKSVENLEPLLLKSQEVLKSIVPSCMTVFSKGKTTNFKTSRLPETSSFRQTSKNFIRIHGTSKDYKILQESSRNFIRFQETSGLKSSLFPPRFSGNVLNFVSEAAMH